MKRNLICINNKRVQRQESITKKQLFFKEEKKEREDYQQFWYDSQYTQKQATKNFFYKRNICKAAPIATEIIKTQKKKKKKTEKDISQMISN